MDRKTSVMNTKFPFICCPLFLVAFFLEDLMSSFEPLDVHTNDTSLKRRERKVWNNIKSSVCNVTFIYVTIRIHVYCYILFF